MMLFGLLFISTVSFGQDTIRIRPIFQGTPFDEGILADTNWVNINVANEVAAQIAAFDHSPYLDNTDDQTVDNFSLAGNILTLELEDDGESPYTVDFTSIVGSSENIANTDLQLDAARILDFNDHQLIFDFNGPGGSGDINIGNELVFRSYAPNLMWVDLSTGQDTLGMNLNQGIFTIGKISGTEIDNDFAINSNKIGIGTTTPSHKLEVTGDIMLDNTDASLYLKGGVAGTKSQIGWSFNTEATTLYAYMDLDYDLRSSQGFRIGSLYDMTFEIANSTNNDFIWVNAGTSTTLMHLDRLGSLGLLTENAGSTFSVNGNVSIGYETSAAPTDGLIVEGWTGLGVTSPDGPLHVYGGVFGTFDIGGVGINATGYYETLSGRSGIVIRNVNDYLNSVNNCAYCFVVDQAVGTLDANDLNYKVIRSRYGSSLEVEPFYVDLEGDIYTAGNVGIGTTSPKEELDVRGNINMESSLPYLFMVDSDSPTEYGQISFNTRLRLDAYSDGNSIMEINPRPGDGTSVGYVDWFRWTNTTAPAGFRIYSADGGTDLQHFLRANGDTYVNRESGNFGVGTALPDWNLHVENEGIVTVEIESTDGNQANLYFDNDGSAHSYFGKRVNGTIDAAFRFNTSGAIDFMTEGVDEKMTLNEDGGLTLHEYGATGFTGTATKLLAVDASGNMIQEDLVLGTDDQTADISYIGNVFSIELEDDGEAAQTVVIPKATDPEITMMVFGRNQLIDRGVNDDGRAEVAKLVGSNLDNAYCYSLQVRPISGTGDVDLQLQLNGSNKSSFDITSTTSKTINFTDFDLDVHDLLEVYVETVNTSGFKGLVVTVNCKHDDN